MTADKITPRVLGHMREAIDQYATYLACVDDLRCTTGIHHEYLEKFIQEAAYEEYYDESGDFDMDMLKEKVSEFIAYWEENSCT